MKKYYFFFNDFGDFTCHIEKDNNDIELYGGDAIKKLITIDKRKYNNVKLNNQHVKLSNTESIVTIYDLEDFVDLGYERYLNNSIKYIKKAASKKHKNNNKNVSNLKLVSKRIAISTALLLVLASSKDALNKNKIEEKEIEISLEKIDSDEYMSSNDISTVVDEDLSDMIDELEEYNYEDDINNQQIDEVYLNYEDLTNTDTYENAYEKFYEIVDTYATKWGISSNVIMAILTQESAGLQTNLMQIQFSSWKDQVLTEYDFVNNKYQSIVLSENPEKYVGKNITVISSKDLENKVTNISVACVILRYCLERMDYNTVAAIQAYNLGVNNMNTVLKETSKQTGISIEDILSDPTNVDFLDYTSIVGCGDPEYLNNVSRYLIDSDDITIKVFNDDGTIDEKQTSIARKAL
jgi:hypothetical protein